MSDNVKWHGTTIVLVRKNNEVVVAGDGQVSLGNTVIKSTAKKVRKIEKRNVIAGFAGSTADALTLSSAGLLTVKDDLVIKAGGTIGGAGDTDLLELGSAILTVNGEVSMTTLDIGGTNVGSTAAELNLLDGSAKSTSSITIADSDAFIVIDGTTTKQIPASDIKTYAGGEDPVAMAIALG